MSTPSIPRLRGLPSAAKQGELSQIAWRQIVGMRNRLSQAYFEINYEVVYKTIFEDLPGLIVVLEAVLGDTG